MKINLKNQGECCLRWQYDNKENPLETKLFLEKDKNNLITKVTVKRYHTDKNDKEQARKFSLTKLLTELSLSKNERKQIWSQYLNR